MASNRDRLRAMSRKNAEEQQKVDNQPTIVSDVAGKLSDDKQISDTKVKEDNKTVDAVKDKKDTQKPEKTVTEKATATTVSEKNDSNNLSPITDNDTSPAVVVEAKISEELCSTTVKIRKSSARYLVYYAKTTGNNQNTSLANILYEEMANEVIEAPDFNAEVEEIPKKELMVKNIILPKDLFLWAKDHAAMEIMSLGEYIDSVLQRKIKEMQNNTN